MEYCKEGMTEEELNKMDVSNDIEMLNVDLDIIHKQLKWLKMKRNVEINETIPTSVTIKQ